MDHLKNKKPEIFFNEWNKIKTLIPIVLVRFLTPQIRKVDSTEYYLFDGFFVDKSDAFRIKKGIPVVFWFSKSCFEREIIRHIDFSGLARQDNRNISMKVIRKSKYELWFSDVELT